MGSDVSDVRDRPLEHTADRLTTAVQQDRNATPSSMRSARVSGGGRYVVFVSSAQLVEADRNRSGDVYVLDLATGHCTLESIGPGGSAGNGESLSPDISRDGRYVVFESAAGNLIDTPLLPGTFRVFLRDRETGVTRLLSANANGEPANGASGNPAISADGTAVVFESTATDLIATHEIGSRSVGIYLIQLTSGRRARLDVPSAGGRQRRPEHVASHQRRWPIRRVRVEGGLDVSGRRRRASWSRRTRMVSRTFTFVTRRRTSRSASPAATLVAIRTAPATTRRSAATGGTWRSFRRRRNLARDSNSRVARHLCARPRHGNHRARQPRAEWASRQRCEPAAGAVSRWWEDRVSVTGLQILSAKANAKAGSPTSTLSGTYSSMTGPHAAPPG